MSNNNHIPRPAAIGSACDAYHVNPNGSGPHLVHCRCRAKFRLTIKTANDCYAVKRCPKCAAELTTRAATDGATFEITDTEELSRDK